MATTKTTRMDAQGRVILPPHIRKELNLNPGQLVDVSLEGDTIRITPAGERCSLCGESVEGTRHANITIGVGKKHICCSCENIIKHASKEEK